MFVVGVALLMGALAGDADPAGVLVLKTQGPGGLGDAIENAVASAISEQRGHAVFRFRDVERQLRLEQQKDLIGCDEVSCYAEIAKALNADILVSTQTETTAENLRLRLRIVLARGEPRTLIDTSAEFAPELIQKQPQHVEHLVTRALSEARIERHLGKHYANAAWGLWGPHSCRVMVSKYIRPFLLGELPEDHREWRVRLTESCLKTASNRADVRLRQLRKTGATSLQALTLDREMVEQTRILGDLWNMSVQVFEVAERRGPTPKSMRQEIKKISKHPTRVRAESSIARICRIRAARRWIRVSLDRYGWAKRTRALGIGATRYCEMFLGFAIGQGDPGVFEAAFSALSTVSKSFSNDADFAAYFFAVIDQDHTVRRAFQVAHQVRLAELEKQDKARLAALERSEFFEFDERFKAYGALSAAQALEAIKGQSGALRHCFERARAREEILAGAYRMFLDLRIAADGSVTEQEVLMPAELKSAATLNICVSSSISQWRFKDAKEGSSIRMLRLVAKVP